MISNASDAIDRARFEALSDESVLEDDPEWKIKIHVDRDAKTLRVVDNGIGMSAEEVEKNIGTIANSGTRKFLEELQKNKEALPPEFIGQFGVGFYSAFMVADKVTVLTRRAGDKAAGTKWESSGDGSYTIDSIEKEKRGTEVILHLKEDDEEFLEEWKIRKVVTKFSDFVEHPVTMDIRREEIERDEDGKPLPDVERKVTITEETLNSQKAIWQRPMSEIEEEEYHEFYKHISHDFQDPFETIHWNVEGVTEFRALLYIPQRTLMDMFFQDERHKGIHLYVKRIFITDNCEELAPQYMRFLRGVVDSSDLPLNVSREILQESKLVRLIRKNLVKKVLDTLGEMMEKNRDRYVTFWTEFGAILKEGIHLDFENREKLQDLCLCQTSKTEDGAFISLAEYVERMPDGQKDIYYLTGESREALENSPHLEAFQSRDYEVLFLTDPIDEWVVNSVRAYKEKTLKSIAKGDIDLDTEDEKKEKEEARKEQEEAYKDLVARIGEILEEKVKEVQLSKRLTESACCLVADEAGMGMHMERIMRAMNRDVPPGKRILELNPDHPVVETMRELLSSDPKNEKLAEYTEMLYDQALLTASLPIEDPLRFAKRVSNLMASEGKSLL